MATCIDQSEAERADSVALQHTTESCATAEERIKEHLRELMNFAVNLCDRCEKLIHIPGTNKLLKKCQAESNFLKKLKTKAGIKECHLNSTNLNHIQGIVEAAECLPHVVQVLQLFHCDRGDHPLEVDVVCNHGYTWVKIVARKAQALHRIWVGQGQFGDKNIITQAEMFKDCAALYPVCFTTPQVLFLFTNGITKPLGVALEQCGISITGEHLDVYSNLHDEPLDSSSMDNQSDLAEDDQSDGNIPTASELFGDKTVFSQFDNIVIPKKSDVDLSMQSLPTPSEVADVPDNDGDMSDSQRSRKTDESAKKPKDAEIHQTLQQKHSLKFSISEIESVFREVPAITLVNLDITSLIAMVSNMCHGGCDYRFREEILTQQATWERARPQLEKMESFIAGKELCVCETAMQDFRSILDTVGGPKEKARAVTLLLKVKVIPDALSDRSQQLELSHKVKHRAKVIFGSGDQVKAVTMTANSGFVRAATNQGISFAVFLHESRALTEQKELMATPL